MGRCCSIPKKYVVASEVYESNDFDGAEEWIRSQRSGRENVGFMFHGPIRLRFDGGWYVAVICLGEQAGDGTCNCDIQPEIYDCSETDDPGYCYYLAGIPGLGVFTPGGDCDCDESGGDGQANTDGGCDKCGGTFEDCELGCSESGCSCCYEEPPPPTADGAACSLRFMVLSQGDIEEQYPEIQSGKNCDPVAAEENTPLANMIEDLVSRGIKRDSITIASFRQPECRIEVWGECDCGEGVDCEGPCEDMCYDSEVLSVDVFDQWQADQIGVEWKELSEDGGCPDACEPPCDETVLPEEVPLIKKETDGAGGDSLNVADTSYERTRVGSPPADAFDWNPDWDPKGFRKYFWYKEQVISNAAFFDSPNPETGFSYCVKYTLVACDPENCQWIDATDEAVTPKGGNADTSAGVYPVENLLDYAYTGITDLISDISEITPECNDMPKVQDMDWFNVGILQQLYLPAKYPCPEGARKKENPMPKRNVPGGAGTELTKLLNFFGIESKEKGCQCRSRAKKMDKNGVEWCSQNIEKIIDWLKEEAQKRKLPFIRTAAKVIVLRAIRNARAKGFE
jgi:hypothetical protein